MSDSQESVPTAASSKAARRKTPHTRAAQPVDGAWRQGWDLSEEERAVFRRTSQRSRERKARALGGDGPTPVHPVNQPNLDPLQLMPPVGRHDLRSLSLFSGGGGLDLGFDLAGFRHVASFDILSIAGETLRHNRPDWKVFSGEEGSVVGKSWSGYRGKVDVLHGGPPCQPFSMAGRQLGHTDPRDMFPQFVRAVLEIKPRAFIAENVAALNQEKFRAYLNQVIYDPLGQQYRITEFQLKAESFGVPQLRTRMFFVGFRTAADHRRFTPPAPTHEFRPAPTADLTAPRDLFAFVPEIEASAPQLQRTMGAREALGLPPIGTDGLAPTIRSGFTGPRHTTSINSSVSALKAWGRLGLWPNGVAISREAASKFVPENKHFRLSVLDCAVLQGFPEAWHFCGAVYSILGQIGNSVAPPMGYRIARAVADALSK